MAIDKVREYFKTLGIEDRVREFSVSSATVELAAEALGVKGQRIAKTMSFRAKDGGVLLIVCAGDVKVDNSKFKQAFSTKAKMLTPDELVAEVGHAMGGVCPFAIPDSVEVYLDESLKRFDTVFPACGSSNSAAEFTCDELFKYSNAREWVDVCKLREEQAQ